MKQILSFEMLETSLSTTFNPPEKASSKQIRIYGLASWLFGLVSMIVIMIFNFGVPSLMKYRFVALSTIILYFISFCLMITGCYRVLTGRSKSVEVDKYEISFSRILLGVMAYFISVGLPATIILMFLYFLQWIGIDPRQLFDNL
jgi:hypothetical protein